MKKKNDYLKFDDMFFYKALDTEFERVASFWRCDGIIKYEDESERFRFVAVPEKEMTVSVDILKEEVDDCFEYIPDFYNIDMEAEYKKEHPFWEMPF